MRVFVLYLFIAMLFLGGFFACEKETAGPDTSSEVFVKIHGGPDWEYAVDMLEMPDGGYCIAGYIHKPEIEEVFPYVIRTDETGQIKWQKSLEDLPGFRAEKVLLGGNTDLFVLSRSQKDEIQGTRSTNLTIFEDIQNNTTKEISTRTFPSGFIRGVYCDLTAAVVNSENDLVLGFTACDDSSSGNISAEDFNSQVFWLDVDLAQSEDFNFIYSTDSFIYFENVLEPNWISLREDGHFYGVSYLPRRADLGASFDLSREGFFIQEFKGATGEVLWQDQFSFTGTYAKLLSASENRLTFFTTEGAGVRVYEIIKGDSRAKESKELHDYQFGVDFGQALDFNFKSWEDFQKTPDEGFLLSGVLQHPTQSTYAGLLIKLDSQGKLEWSRHYTLGDVLNIAPHAFNAIPTSDGGYAISGAVGRVTIDGTPKPDLNIFQAKISSTGELISSK